MGGWKKPVERKSTGPPVRGEGLVTPNRGRNPPREKEGRKSHGDDLRCGWDNKRFDFLKGGEKELGTENPDRT